MDKFSENFLLYGVIFIEHCALREEYLPSSGVLTCLPIDDELPVNSCIR